LTGRPAPEPYPTMTATKILWGQILAVALIVLVTTWGATQWVAWRLGFQAQLGPALFDIWGMPVYPPPAFFWWWYFYDAYARTVFWEGGAIAASGGFISIAVAITMSVIRAREAADVDTYGSARWAKRSEVEAAGLLGSDGVVLGKLDQDYLRHDGPEHVLCFAPTRSGKGVGLVVPTLLSSHHFCLIPYRGFAACTERDQGCFPGLVSPLCCSDAFERAILADPA